jgi:hypothetical protein
VKSIYTRYREYRSAGFAPTPAAQVVAELYGRRTPAEVNEVTRAMRALEARDGAPAGAPLAARQSTTRKD